MGKTQHIGEFEQIVLLTLLRCAAEPYAVAVRRELERVAGRGVSRGALYRTLDRMYQKGYVEWDMERAALPERGGHPMRRLAVTDAGLEALRASRSTLLKLWDGLEAVLDRR